MGYSIEMVNYDGNLICVYARVISLKKIFENV